MLGTINALSDIEIKLENICKEHLIIEKSYPDLGSFVCCSIVTDEAVNLFKDNPAIKEWQLGCSDWPDETGGCCFVSWIENGHLHTFEFDYIY